MGKVHHWSRWFAAASLAFMAMVPSAWPQRVADGSGPLG